MCDYVNPRKLARSLTIESLETRRVFAVDDLTSVADLASQAAALHFRNQAYRGSYLPPDPISFAQKNDLLQALSPKLEQYWQSFFGKPVRETLEREVSENSVLDVMPLSEFNRANFVQSGKLGNGLLVTVDAQGQIDIVDMRNGENPVVVGSIPGTDSLTSILVDGNRLVTIKSAGYWTTKGETSGYAGLETQIDSYDLSNPSAPQLQGSMVVDGVRAGARLQAGQLKLVVDNFSPLPAPAVYSSADSQRFEVADEYTNRVGDKVLDAILPDYQLRSLSGLLGARQNIGSWRDIVVTDSAPDNAVTTMVFDVSRGIDILASTTIAGQSAGNVYISPQNFYLNTGGSIIRVHYGSDGKLTTAAAPGSFQIFQLSSYMDENDGILRVVGMRENVDQLITYGNVGDQWRELSAVELPNPVYLVTFQGQTLVALEQTTSTLAIYDVSDPSSPKRIQELPTSAANFLNSGDDWFATTRYTNPDGSQARVNYYKRQSSGQFSPAGQTNIDHILQERFYFSALSHNDSTLSIRYLSNGADHSGKQSIERVLNLDTQSTTTPATEVVYTKTAEDLSFPSPPPLEIKTFTEVTVFNRLTSAAVTKHDINSDGFLTALDVLQIVNYINRVADTEAQVRALGEIDIALLDITGDGQVTGLDVLQVVNAINISENAASTLSVAPLDDLNRWPHPGGTGRASAQPVYGSKN